MWPSRTAGHNLKSKFARYKGNTDLYQKNALNHKPYNVVATPEAHHEPGSKSAMTKRKYGKHTTNQILGTGAMENSSLPDFVVEQAYAHMSRSIAVGTAVQYRAAINIIEEQNSFDKSVTLMQEDVKITQLKSNGVMTRAITLHLKNPKENKSKHGVRVDIFETTGPLRWLCAMNAYTKYVSSTTATTSAQPFATMSDGTGYTGCSTKT